MTKKRKEQDTPPSSEKRVGFRFNRPDDVRRLLQRGINQTLGDQLSTDKLRAISYAAQVMLKVFELTTLEERLKAIEEAIEGRIGGN